MAPYLFAAPPNHTLVDSDGETIIARAGEVVDIVEEKARGLIAAGLPLVEAGVDFVEGEVARNLERTRPSAQQPPAATVQRERAAVAYTPASTPVPSPGGQT